MTNWRSGVLSACLFLLLGAFPSRAAADGLLSAHSGGVQAPMVLFPNWRLAAIGDFGLWICEDAVCGCVNGPIVALTIVNTGDCKGGAGGDLVTVYFQLLCGATDSGYVAMTYAGDWMWGTDMRSAWTWSGSIPWAYDPYHTQSCAGNATLRIFADVGPCPAEGCTIVPALPAFGVVDSCPYAADPTWAAVEPTRTIQYVSKVVDRSTAIPAETVNFTIYYGLPGSSPLSGVTIVDTLPVDTSYVVGSSNVTPDPEWDPKAGPPQQVRWTLPGGVTTGGATREIHFAASVNWGNEPYEPGSGIEGAIEGSRLINRADVEFVGTSCARSIYSTFPVSANVRRYLAWAIGDNDMLFAPKIGMPDDEMIYEIFIRNESSTRTWHNLQVWDTVPPELTVWGGNFGFEDPCIGWTMTPVCSLGSPSWHSPSPGVDVLRWTIDLPPNGTITLRWKAQVNTATSAPGDTALNVVSMMSLGQRGLNGDGSARAPRSFVHLANIVLRTTYFSYMGHSAVGDCKQGFIINFYPLNRMATFELRKLEYNNVPFASTGGLSAPINNFVGTCIAGFPESRGGGPGCGSERVPAQYIRFCSDISWPYTYAYKLTSNCPLIWMYMQLAPPGSGDQITYIGATNESFAGYMLYTWRRVDETNTVGYGDFNLIFNTGIDVWDDYDPTRPTLVHIFQWDMTNLRWRYVKSGEIDGESLWIPIAGTTSSQVGHYRFVSSTNKLVIWQGFNLPLGQSDHGTMAPNAQNGLFVSQPGGPANFYAMANWNLDSEPNMLIGNVEPGKPTNVRIWKYRSNNPVDSIGIPGLLSGTSGTWVPIGLRTIGAGLNDPTNAWASGSSYDPLITDITHGDFAFKVEYISGGRIQVHTGGGLFDQYAGGSQIHGAEGLAGTGHEFWIHTAAPTTMPCADTSPYNIMIFCPAKDMILKAESADSGQAPVATAEYRTDSIDQMVSFMGQTTMLAAPMRRNWRFWLDETGAQGDLMALWGQCNLSEKFYVAPFVHVGVHYDIFAPPVVYSGQEFWLTVVVVSSGATKMDYCGTTGFTSTDPLAGMEGVAMALYNYAWSSDIASCGSGSDNGVRIFTKTTFNQPGMQTIVASDILDGSIVGIVTIAVVAVDIKFFKEPRVGGASSGDTVQFRICWSNYSSGSAFEFVITDAVPKSMAYIQADHDDHFCEGTYGPVAGTAAYSTTDSNHASFQDIPAGGTSSAVAWLRWTIPTIGPATTGCVCFLARVD